MFYLTLSENFNYLNLIKKRDREKTLLSSANLRLHTVDEPQNTLTVSSEECDTIDPWHGCIKLDMHGYIRVCIYAYQGGYMNRCKYIDVYVCVYVRRCINAV